MVVKDNPKVHITHTETANLSIPSATSLIQLFPCNVDPVSCFLRLFLKPTSPSCRCRDGAGDKRIAAVGHVVHGAGAD